MLCVAGCRAWAERFLWLLSALFFVQKRAESKSLYIPPKSPFDKGGLVATLRWVVLCRMCGLGKGQRTKGSSSP